MRKKLDDHGAEQTSRGPIQGEVVFDSDRPAGTQIDWQLELLSQWMDSAFRIPGLGWRFGLDALAGLLPGIGDAATSLVSLYILTAAARYKIPRITIARMGLNVALDYIVGSVPIAGDLFDAWWKCNDRNLKVLRRHVADPSTAQQGTRADWLFVALMIVVLVLILLGAIALSWYLMSIVFKQILAVL